MVLSLLFLLPACGVWDFFSAYFNTYYNAKTLYGQAVDEVWAMPELRETGRNLLALVPISSGPKTKFTAVIEKCSKLLQYHPESNLVDDALLMIGRSYYFEGEFQQADRKCRELIDGYPDSPLLDETKILLSYCLYKSRDTVASEELAIKLLEDATVRDESGLMADAALVLAQLALDRKSNVRVRQMLEVVGEHAPDPDMRANAFLRVAELYAEEKNFLAAEKAYGRARGLSRGYVGEFRGLFGAAKMIAKQGDYDLALERIEDLRGSLNYRESWGDLDVEVANIYRNRGDIAKAVEQYRYVDTAYARGESALNANYELGLLYELRFQLYDSAKVAFDRARSGPPLAKNMPIVIRKSEYLGRFLQHRREVNRLDSTLQAVLHPPDTAASADSVLVRADSLANDSTALARADSLRPKTPPVPPMHPDTVRTRLAGAIDDLAGVFYANMELPDSARYWYRRLVKGFPESRSAPRAFYVLARIESNDSTVDRAVPDSLYRCIVEKYSTSPFADEARRLLGLPPVVKAVDPAEESYARGVHLMQAGKSGAAIDTFTVLVKHFPASPAAVRAMYAAGWLYENEARSQDSAAAFYERLVARAPSSAYAQKVGPRVQEVQGVRRAAQEKARADSVAKAAAAAAALDSIKAKQAPKTPAVHDSLQSKQAVTPSVLGDSLRAKSPDSTSVAGDSVKVRRTADPDADEVEARRRGARPGAAPDTKQPKPRETPEEQRVD
jgi:tetratricopeptide (TPR) repeat protein